MTGLPGGSYNLDYNIGPIYWINHYLSLLKKNKWRVLYFVLDTFNLITRFIQIQNINAT